MTASTKKNGWTTVAFGDVVKLSKERSSDPEADGLERYIGLDHIDPNDLKIRRWGNVADGVTFTSVFHPGQVLFGKRRAYQRKVAIAEFSGVCSGDIYVLEPKNKLLLPELLPFICQTDTFFEHAVGTSAGSLSPRTNWTSLASFEFALPPIDVQRQIVAALCSADDVAHSLWSTRERIVQMVNRFAIDVFQDLQHDCPEVPVTQIGDATMGRQKSPKYSKGINPRSYMRVANVGHLEMRLDEVETMDFSDAEMTKFRLRSGDILLTEGDLISHFNVGRPAIFQGEIKDCCFQNTLIRFRPNEDVPSMFALLLLEGARLNHVFAKAAKTTTVTHLGLGRFKQILLPLPNAARQQTLGHKLKALLDARAAILRRLTDAQSIKRMVMGRVFE